MSGDEMVPVGSVVGSLCVALGLLSQTAPPVQAATLLHEYLFTTPGAVTDSVGGANGTLFGGASVAGGILSLDGVDDYVEFGSKLVPTGLNAFSVTLDARQLSRTPGVFVALISQGQSGANGFYIGHNTVGDFRFGDQHTVTGQPYPTDNLFHSFALTSDALGTNFYVDGSLIFTSGIQIAATALGTNTRLGRQFDPFSEFFHGNLDNVRIYSGALTAEEIGGETSVPAPGALALFGLGLVGIGFAGRRRAG
jgi:hypothetical protein